MSQNFDWEIKQLISIIKIQQELLQYFIKEDRIIALEKWKDSVEAVWPEVTNGLGE